MKKKQEISISIRTKIIFLVAITLVVSLGSSLWIATSLFVDDKASYVYDYSIQQLKSTSAEVEQKVKKIKSAAAAISTLLDVKDIPKNAVDHAFNLQLKDMPVNSLLILRAPTIYQFLAVAELGMGIETVLKDFSNSKWTPHDYRKKAPFSLALTTNNRLLLGGELMQSLNNDNGFYGFFTSFELTTQWLEQEPHPNVEMDLFFADGRRVLSKPASTFKLSEEKVNELAKSVYQNSFGTGAIDWNHENETYILSYQKLFEGQLILLRFTSKADAFTAAKALLLRTLTLGFSIFLVAMGFTLVFARTLTSRLREMWETTQKVISGDFTSRVKVKSSKLGNDEINGLAASFNVMSNKIDELMDQTAEKARMEKELETAQTVQNMFFPEQGFKHPNLMLAGKCFPASECGGDWWYYALIDRFVIAVIGDVTGHGVSAALMTSGASVAFSAYISECRKTQKPPQVKELVEFMHHALSGKAAQASGMSFLAMVIDLDSGQSQMVNASHRPPYLFRESAKKKVKALVGGNCSAFGDNRFLQDDIQPVNLQLNAGDVLVLYTDGLIECTNDKQEQMGKGILIQNIEKFAQLSGDPQVISDNLSQESMTYMGPEKAKRLEDDVTTLIITIPKTAQFKSQEPVAA